MRIPSLRRFAAAAFGLCAIATAGGAAAIIDQRPASALTNCTVSDLSIDGEETAFLGLINQYRAQSGLGALTISTNLNRAASWMVVDLATKNYFAHTDSLGRSPSTRAVECGYPTGAGENLAAGTVRDTAQEAFDAWKASAGHNANMLTASYKQIGIARFYGASSTYGWYWGTSFGNVDDGTGGGATPPPPPVVTATRAAITSPANGSTLAGASATFNWAAGSGALEYFLYAGTTAGANNLYGASQGLALSRTLAGLPTNGSTVHLRLWTRSASGWAFNDYTYRAATVSTTPPPATSTKASLVSPAAGSIIPSVNAPFSWTAASGGQEYFLYIGTTQGANNLYGQSQGTATSATVARLTVATPAWVRLWTRTAAGWAFTDYQFAGVR